VAVRALRSYIAEDRLGVALRATHAFVHAAQRIFRCVVIEFRNSSDGLPSTQGVAVLTWNAEAPMGASRGRGRLRLTACHASRQDRQCDREMQ
jgi:hypothetical protein